MKVARKHTQSNNMRGTLSFIAAIAAASAVQPALALDRTWVGSGYWDIPRNWSPAGLPASNDRAIINGGVSLVPFNTNVAGLEFAAGEIGGSGRLTVTGPGIWNGGSFAGPGATHFAGSLYVSGNQAKTIHGGRVVSVTDTTWGNNTAPDSNVIGFNSGPGGASSIINMGTWNDTNTFATQIKSDYPGPSAFHNIGTYNKQGHATTIIGATYHNTGTTNVNAGKLLLGGGGSSTGSFNIAANSTLEFTAGDHKLNDATTSGTGTLDIRGNSIVSINGGKHATPVLISQDGQLKGEGHTFDGPATWTGGSIKGGGLTAFGGSLSITGDSEKKIDAGRIVAVNDTTWGGSTRPDSNGILFNSDFSIQSLPSWIVNSGTWNDTNSFNSAIGGVNAAFHNNGTYNKLGNALTVMAADYSNTGTTDVNAGKMAVAHSFSNSGEIVVSVGASFQVVHVRTVWAGGMNSETDTRFENAMSGVIRGWGTVIPPSVGLTNRGAINPGYLVGALTIDGDLHQAASGVLNIEISSLSNFDQLTVTDDVTLGGTLAISNEGYTPVVGDRFVIATFDERLTGSTFSSVILNGFSAGVDFDVIYNEHNVTLAVTAAPAATAATAVPEPQSWAMLLAGLAVAGPMVRRRHRVPTKALARASSGRSLSSSAGTS
jgi:hypothetical protein